MNEDKITWDDIIETMLLGVVFYSIWNIYVGRVDSLMGFLVVFPMYFLTNFIHGFIMAFIESDDDSRPTGTV